jgi:hypothetical protein
MAVSESSSTEEEAHLFLHLFHFAQSCSSRYGIELRVIQTAETGMPPYNRPDIDSSRASGYRNHTPAVS